MAEKGWKRRERRTAEQLGGSRTSKVGTSSPDVTTPWLIAEVKSKKELPAWILDAVAKARSHAKNGQLGIAVLHQRGKKDDLVVLKMSDFKEWFGNGKMCLEQRDGLHSVHLEGRLDPPLQRPDPSLRGEVEGTGGDHLEAPAPQYPHSL